MLRRLTRCDMIDALCQSAIYVPLSDGKGEMDAVRSQCERAVKKIQSLIQPRISVYFLGPSCDSQSICARRARDIVSLMDKKKNTMHQNERIKEEILALVDHEKLPTRFQCNALALLTLSEALRYLLHGKAKEEDVKFLEEILLQVQTNYHSKIIENDDFESPPSLNGLVYQHLGHGMKYLAELSKIKKGNENGKG